MFYPRVLLVALSFMLLLPAFGASNRGAEFKEILRDPIPLFFECNLRSKAVECVNIRSEFTSRYGRYFRVVNASRDALVTVELTDQSAAGTAMTYTFEWSAKEPYSVEDRKDVIKLDPGVLLSTALQSKLAIRMFLTATDYLSIANAEIEENGAITLTPDSDGGEGAAKRNFFTRLENSPFFGKVHAMTGGNNNGSVQKGGYSELDVSVNYSTDKYRFAVGGFTFIQSETQPGDAGTKLKASNAQKGFKTIAARSFGKKKRWSFGVISEIHSNRGNNENLTADGATGIEYNVVPYRTTENQELYVRVGTGIREIDLLLENELGHRVHSYHFVYSEVGAYWTLFDSNFIVTATGKAKVYSKQPKYSQYGGAVGLRYRTGSIVTLNANYSFGFQEKSLSFPKNPNYTNPLMTQFLTGSPGRNSSFTIGFLFNIGNAGRFSGDSRWVPRQQEHAE
jgi:hypothetical protein